MKTFIVDLDKCNGCYACQLACKDENVGNAWPPYSKPEPSTGQFWLKMFERTHGQVPKVRIEYRPMLCRHCEYCPLIEAAPEAVYRREDGLVIIDPEKAAGRKDLVHLCSYDVVYWNEELDLAQKCTGCAHLIDDPEQPIRVPRCMDNCHLDVIRFGEESEFDLTGMEVLHPEYKTDPHVYYTKLPKKFIAGTVYDPEAEEIVEGATVTATCAEGNATATTDHWGDFWLEDLPDAQWRITIEKDGKQAELEVSTMEEDQGLKDIPLA